MAGGVIHGMGGALYEELSYTTDGQLETGSFVEYLCPTAAEAPEIHLGHVDVPSPFNPLGAKGGGESSSMSAPAAIAAAVDDALSHAAIRIDRLPVRPADLWARVDGRAGGR
jgi:2-furoyl-CoA dehydrogenase large subunit